MTFRNELQALINRESKENGSNTPDFVLARYLHECLDVFDRAVNLREEWHANKTIGKAPKALEEEDDS